MNGIISFNWTRSDKRCKLNNWWGRRPVGVLTHRDPYQIELRNIGHTIHPCRVQSFRRVIVALSISPSHQRHDTKWWHPNGSWSSHWNESSWSSAQWLRPYLDTVRHSVMWNRQNTQSKLQKGTIVETIKGILCDWSSRPRMICGQSALNHRTCRRCWTVWGGCFPCETHSSSVCTAIDFCPDWRVTHEYFR